MTTESVFQVRPSGDGTWQVNWPEGSATFDAKLDAVEHAREKASQSPEAVVVILDEAG